jgi:hypothetical protein
MLYELFVHCWFHLEDAADHLDIRGDVPLNIVVPLDILYEETNVGVILDHLDLFGFLQQFTNTGFKIVLSHDLGHSKG